MSVIITNREIPKGCLGCDYFKAIIRSNDDICELTGARFKNSTASYENRQDNCPLKSVEGLIDAIYKKANSGQWNDAVVFGAGLAVKIIKDYCEVIK